MARASATIARLKNVRLSVSVLYVVCGGGWSKPVCIVLMPRTKPRRSRVLIDSIVKLSQSQQSLSSVKNKSGRVSYHLQRSSIERYIATRKYSSTGMAIETVSRKRRREEETNGGNEFPNRRKKSRQENNMQLRTHRSSRCYQVSRT